MKNALTLNEVIARVSNIKAGTYHSVTFYSDKKTIDGRVIHKISKTTMRTKIDHTHCNDYEEPEYNRVENCEYIVKNAIKVNKSTGNYLLKLLPVYSTYTSKYEDENGVEIDEKYAKSIIKESKRSGKIPKVITVNADKILSV